MIIDTRRCARNTRSIQKDLSIGVVGLLLILDIDGKNVRLYMRPEREAASIDHP